MTTITALPLPIPTTTNPDSFSPRADALFQALASGITEMNTQNNEIISISQNVDSVAASVKNSLGEVTDLEAAVTLAATQASASTLAPTWVSGTTYTEGTVRWSPLTGMTYRRLSTGAGTTDPSNDAANWRLIGSDVKSGFPKVRPTVSVDFTSRKTAPKNITFTRASEAYYTSDESFVVEQNLLNNSEVFSGLGWGTASNAVVTPGFTAPNGLATAYRLTHLINSLNGIILFSEPNLGSVASKTFTVSIWLKSNTGSSQSVILYCVQSGVDATSTTVTVTTSWQRFSVTRVNTSAASTNQGLYLSAGSNNAGDILVWGAQLEEASSVGNYIKTTGQGKVTSMLKMKKAAVGVPRISFDPLTHESNGVHIEQAGIGLWKDNSAVNGIATNTGIIQNSGLAPDGMNSASLLLATNSLSEKWISGNVAHLDTSSKILSAYVKPFGVTKVRFNLWNGSALSSAYFDLVSKEVHPTSTAAAGIIDVGGGWLRIWARVNTVNSTSGQHSQWIQLLDDSWEGVFQGDGFSGVYIWGIQYESSAVLTSLMPLVSNYGSRAQDNLTIPGEYKNSGSIYIDYSIPVKSLNHQVICTLFASNQNWIDALAVPGNDIYIGARLIANGAVQQTSDTYQNTIGSFNKICLSFNEKLKTVTSSVNAVTDSSETASVYPQGFQHIFLGKYHDSNYALNGFVRSVKYYPSVLSVNELQSLTLN
jgi:hypothetical protein